MRLYAIIPSPNALRSAYGSAIVGTSPRLPESELTAAGSAGALALNGGENGATGSRLVLIQQHSQTG